jgi:hypothetical protein
LTFWGNSFPNPIPFVNLLRCSVFIWLTIGYFFPWISSLARALR